MSQHVGTFTNSWHAYIDTKIHSVLWFVMWYVLTWCKGACLKCFIGSLFAKSIFFYQQKGLTRMQWHWDTFLFTINYPRWNQPLLMKWTNLLYYIMALWTLPATCTVWSHETHSAFTQSNIPQPMISLTCTLIIYWPQHQQCVYILIPTASLCSTYYAIRMHSKSTV